MFLVPVYIFNLNEDQYDKTGTVQIKIDSCFYNDTRKLHTTKCSIPWKITYTNVHKTFYSIYLLYNIYKHNANDWNGGVCVEIKSSSSVI